MCFKDVSSEFLTILYESKMHVNDKSSNQCSSTLFSVMNCRCYILKHFPSKGRFRCMRVNHASRKSLTELFEDSCVRLYACAPLLPILLMKMMGWKIPQMKEHKASRCNMTAKLTASDRLSRLFWRSNERFLWEAMSAGEWRWNM